jgi:hypothetical protein
LWFQIAARQLAGAANSGSRRQQFTMAGFLLGRYDGSKLPWRKLDAI